MGKDKYIFLKQKETAHVISYLEYLNHNENNLYNT